MKKPIAETDLPLMGRRLPVNSSPLKDSTLKKLKSYSYLSSSLLLMNSIESEGQVVYVDLPDPVFEVSKSFTVPDNSTSIETSILNYAHLNLKNGSVFAGGGAVVDSSIIFELRAIVKYQNYTSNSFTVVAENYAYALNWIVAQKSDVWGMSYPSNLTSNQFVFGTTGFDPANGVLDFIVETKGVINNQKGEFNNGGSAPNDIIGYLGVKFNIGGIPRNGWVRVRIESDTQTSTGVGGTVAAYSRITFLDYAYEGQQGVPIQIGDTGPTRPIPTLTQWGMGILSLLLMILGVVTGRQSSRTSERRGHFLQR